MVPDVKVGDHFIYSRRSPARHGRHRLVFYSSLDGLALGRRRNGDLSDGRWRGRRRHLGVV